jgi:hypothetical protein
MARVKIELTFEPVLTPLQDVGTALFGSMRRLLWNGPPLITQS